MLQFALRVAVLALALALALAPALSAQRINIDFSESPTEVPPPTFAGAGLPGFWNGVSPVAAGPALPLRDYLGACTEARVSVPQFTGKVVTMSDPFLPADVNLLFKDGFIGGDLGDTLTISRLHPGQYNIILYGLVPTQPSSTTIFSPGNPVTGVGGFFQGTFAPGLTHATVTANVGPSGKFSVRWFTGGVFFPTIGWFSGMQLEPVTPAFDGAPSQVSLSSGGQQTLTLNAGVERAGQFYVILGSSTGVYPGLQLGRFCLPLEVDAYFEVTYQSHAYAGFGNYIGVLDANGGATASLTVPPGSDPALAGVTLYHAYLTAKSFRDVEFASNAAPIELIP